MTPAPCIPGIRVSRYTQLASASYCLRLSSTVQAVVRGSPRREAAGGLSARLGTRSRVRVLGP